jgi:hypothetical protein
VDRSDDLSSLFLTVDSFQGLPGSKQQADNNAVLNSPAYRRADNKKNDVYVYIVPTLSKTADPNANLLGYCNFPSSKTDGCVIKYDTLTDVSYIGKGGVPGNTLPHEIGGSREMSGNCVSPRLNPRHNRALVWIEASFRLVSY